MRRNQNLALFSLLLSAALPLWAAGPESGAATPSLTVTGELWHNAGGGQRTGSDWNTLVDAGLAVDLARLGGPADSSLFAQVLWVANRDAEAGFGDRTGAANPASGIMAGDGLRVFNLFYRQTWGDDRFALKIGQLAVDDDFMGSDYAGLFAFSAVGAMPSQVATPLSVRHGNNAAAPIYAVAAPGVWFSVRANERFSFQSGLYHGGPGADSDDNHGFDHDDGAGAVCFYEGAWSFDLGGRASTVRLGGAVHFGRFDDFAALNAGNEEATARGLHSFYAVQDLVLVATDAEHPKLGVFWRAGVSPRGDRSVVRYYGDAGLNWFAPIPGRVDDIVGLAISYTEYGREFRRTDEALAAAETALELTYRAQLSGHLATQVIVQRHFNPLPAADARRHAATVLGLRAEVAF